jgi:hypothetical protein
MVPPGPVANVIVGHPTDARTTRVLPGKMDTGSDVTLVPIFVVVQLGALSHGRCWLRGHGTSIRAGMYDLNINVEGYEVPAVRCIATKRDNVLLGRDVLNDLSLPWTAKTSFFR